MKPFFSKLLPIIEAGNISGLRRFALPIACVCAALVLRLWLNSFTTSSPLIFFFLAVLVAAAYGGFQSGVLATLLSVLAAEYYLFMPTENAADRERDVIILTLFAVQGLGISGVAALMHRAYRELGRRNIELENERRQKDDFISMASHELKTPLTSLTVFAQILLRRLGPVNIQELNHLAEKVLTQSKRLSELVDDLLDLTRLGSGKLTIQAAEFDLSQLAAEIVENFQTTTTTHAIILTGARGARVTADRDRIAQVIANFLTNAVKYSPRGKRILVRHYDYPQEAVLSVQDFGIGIKPEHQERIFERFFRVYDTDIKTFPGLGVGLYICAEIIRRHNGRIWLESKVGEGSTFYFALPSPRG